MTEYQFSDRQKWSTFSSAPHSHVDLTRGLTHSAPTVWEQLKQCSTIGSRYFWSFGFIYLQILTANNMIDIKNMDCFFFTDDKNCSIINKRECTGIFKLSEWMFFEWDQLLTAYSTSWFIFFLFFYLFFFLCRLTCMVSHVELELDCLFIYLLFQGIELADRTACIVWQSIPFPISYDNFFGEIFV